MITIQKVYKITLPYSEHEKRCHTFFCFQQNNQVRLRSQSLTQNSEISSSQVRCQINGHVQKREEVYTQSNYTTEYQDK